MASYSSNPIIDPDALSYVISSTPSSATSELIVDTTNKKIILKVYGNLTTDGVTLKCLYSKLKEIWRTDTTLIKYPFPIGPITDEQFELINGWNFDSSFTSGTSSAKTIELIRTSGWAVVNTSGVTTEMWAGIITLGSFAANTDQAYFQQVSSGASSNILLTNNVNQAIQIYSDPNGDGSTADGFDRRSYFKLFVREYQKQYAQSSISDIGVSLLTYQAYRFPLSNTTDLKISHADGSMSGAPYSGITITYYGSDQSKSIGGSSYPFRVIIEGNSATAEQIYEKVQYQLRQNSDIDAGAGTVTGKTADSLLKFVGDTLVTSQGVYINNFNASDTNRLEFYDQNNVKRTFPYVSIITINFGDNLRNDAFAKYWLFFSNANGNLYGSDNAIIVKDNSNADISGNVSGVASVTKTFNYDGNVQGGRTAATDADVTLVALGLSTAQFAKVTGTINRSTSISLSLSNTLERNYSNP